MRLKQVVVAGLAVLLVLGCDVREDLREPPPAGSAALVGVVRLIDEAVLPAYGAAELGWGRLVEGDLGDADCPPRTREAVLTLAADRGIGGVVVAASGFRGKHLYPKRTRRVVFEGCRLEPAMTAATMGDTLELENRGKGDVPVTFGPAAEPIALRPGFRPRLPLAPGFESLMCPSEAGCGRADVAVFQHSVHAVTDAQGRFVIEGFPAHQNVNVHAWHPLLSEVVTQVWVEPGERREVTLVIRPKPPTDAVRSP